jgi:hypothetical protein
MRTRLAPVADLAEPGERADQLLRCRRSHGPRSRVPGAPLTSEQMSRRQSVVTVSPSYRWPGSDPWVAAAALVPK